MNRIQECNTFSHRTLEGLSTGDEPCATTTLINDGSADRIGKIGGSLRFAARINETDSAHVAIRDLPTGVVDWMLGDEIAVDEFRRLSEAFKSVVAAVVGWKLLLDDVCLDRDAEMIGLRS